MKKFLTLFFAAALLFCLCACQDDTQSDGDAKQSSETTQGTSVPKVSMDQEKGGLVYVKHQLVTDYDEQPAILIYFDYTNKGKSTSTAQDVFYPQVFQNGIECEMTLPLDDDKAIQNVSKEVRPDTKISVGFIYRLEDVSSPVTLKVSDTSTLDELYQEQTLLLE